MNATNLIELKTLLGESLRRLYDLDAELLKNKTPKQVVSERCLVFRLGWYLQTLLETHKDFKTYRVDAEYNRYFGDPKRVGFEKNCRKVIPDLIIHRRGTQTDNLAVFEFKKGGAYSPEDQQRDFIKLQYFTDPNKGYAYQFGFGIVFGEDKANVHVFQRGDQTENYIWKAGDRK